MAIHLIIAQDAHGHNRVAGAFTDGVVAEQFYNALSMTHQPTEIIIGTTNDYTVMPPPHELGTRLEGHVTRQTSHITEVYLDTGTTLELPYERLIKTGTRVVVEVVEFRYELRQVINVLQQVCVWKIVS